MVQDPRYIDLRRSYTPGDPDAFPTQLQVAASSADGSQEDASGRVPIVPYDGYNFVPTPQGYSSFFGVNSYLGVDALTGNVDEVFVIQSNTFANKAVALKDSGIWTKDLSAGGAWTNEIALAVPGTHRQWSMCVIDQDVYVYRQAEASFWKAGPSTGYVFTAFVPTYLTMSAQLGIFKAGGRLGFWDSANSTAWSAFGDTANFTPSVETLAGASIFQDIVGRIVTVIAHGNGFIIYCTRSIVLVIRDVNSPMLFRGKAIFNNNGIAYRNEACSGDPDTQHFALTTTGFCEIKEGEASFGIPEISRFLKEKREPIYLKLINGKYLFFQLLSADFLLQRTAFSNFFSEAALLHWAAANAAAWTLPIADAMVAVRQANWTREEIYLNRQYGYTSFTAASGVGVVPIWRKYLHTCVQAATLASFKTSYDAGTASTFLTPTTLGTSLPNFAGGYANVNVTQVTGGQIPNAAQFKLAFNTAPYQIQDNTQEEFYSKQEWLWDLEDKLWTELKAKLYSMNTETLYSSVYYSYEGSTKNTAPVVFDYTPSANKVIHFGKSAERDKTYGLATKSCWAQKSIVKEVSWIIRRTRYYRYEDTECFWVGISPFTPSWVCPQVETYRELAIDNEGLLTTLVANLATAVGGSFTYVYMGMVETPADGSAYGGLYRSVTFNWYRYSGTTFMEHHYVNYKPLNHGILYSSETNGVILPVGKAVFTTREYVLETFEPIFTETELTPGQYKALGYTQIVGHGHYNAGPVFVVDNATPEAVDYVDQYLTVADGTEKFFYVNTTAGSRKELPEDPWHECGKFADRDADTTINGVTYAGPCEPALEIPPGGPVLLQAGSIEPVYPTFKAAFVFDILLKKWGKGVLDYKNVFDIYPINNMAGEGIFAYENFLPKMGMRFSDGTFPVLDEYPASAEICYGKVGYNRKGYTDLEEVIAHHRSYRTGSLSVEPAVISSRSFDSTYIQTRTYENAVEVREGFNMSARWYNIVFRGHFDLTHLEVRTVRAGSR